MLTSSAVPDEAGTIFIPVWPSRWVPPVACTLMVLTLILKIIDDIMQGPREPTQSAGHVA